MEKWEDGYYITAMAGSAAGSSLVVMSKGTPYTQQSYKVSGEWRQAAAAAAAGSGECCCGWGLGGWRAGVGGEACSTGVDP